MFIFLIIAILMLCIRGANKGILLLIYGLVAWVFVVFFIKAASPAIEDYINEQTSLPQTISESYEYKINKNIDSRLSTDGSTVTIEGSGVKGILALFPAMVNLGIDAFMADAREAIVKSLVDDMTGLTVEVLAHVFAFLIAIIITALGSGLVKLIGNSSVLRRPNAFLGIIVGAAQAIFLVWFVMYIAICFNNTDWGASIINQCVDHPVLSILYETNPIVSYME